MMADQAGQAPPSDKLLDAAGITIDRLPMLHVIFDRMATISADALRHMSASPSYFSLSNIEHGRIGEVLEAYESNAVAGVFYAPEWDSRILIGLDRDFVFTMIEVLFGADGMEPPVDDERSFSNVELRVAQSLLELIGKGFHSSFGMMTDAPLKFERLETRMDFAIIGRRNSMAVVAKLLVQAIGRGGEMFVVIPQSALHLLRQSLVNAMAGEAAIQDPRWSKQIQGEIQRTEVALRAVLEERQLTLGEIADLKVGQVIELKATPRSLVKIECKDQPLFWCQLGQQDGVYTLRVHDAIDPHQDFIDDILPG
jgi:flagellar motor switch protein FliM